MRVCCAAVVAEHEVRRLDARLAVGEQERALHDVLELAHVAGPRVRLELRKRGRRHGRRRERTGCDEARRQRGDVAGALAQRRDAQRKDTEAVVEILTERAFAHGLLEIAIARGEHAHVERHGLARAERLDLALLQHAQELGLQAELHLRDLVEQQRAAVRLHELADAAGLRAREGALLMAEQQRLEHLLRNRGAVDCDERPRARVSTGCE